MLASFTIACASEQANSIMWLKAPPAGLVPDNQERWLGTFSENTQQVIPDSKVHGANMGPIWGRQDPGGPHVG